MINTVTTCVEQMQQRTVIKTGCIMAQNMYILMLFPHRKRDFESVCHQISWGRWHRIRRHSGSHLLTGWDLNMPWRLCSEVLRFLGRLSAF